jgi:hypothetical protein
MGAWIGIDGYIFISPASFVFLCSGTAIANLNIRYIHLDQKSPATLLVGGVEGK